MFNKSGSGNDYVENIISKQPFGWELSKQAKLGKDHFSFEELDPWYWEKILTENWRWCYYGGVAYLVTIYGLQKWMKNKSAYDLKTAFFLWNATLGLFSIVGTARTLPGIVHAMSVGGIYNSICSKINTDIQFACWSLLFVWSKYLELGDTVFLALKKKPIVFLQWGHHLGALIISWTVSPYVEPVMRLSVVINLGVHALMYPYFALRTVGVKMPNFISRFITTIQFTQMIAGFLLQIVTISLYSAGYTCFRNPYSVKTVTITYFLFIIMFGNLWYRSVFKPVTRKNDAKEVKMNGKKVD